MDKLRKELADLFYKLQFKLIDEEVIPANSDLSELFFDFMNTLNRYCEESSINSSTLERAIKTFENVAELTKGPYADKYHTKESYHDVMWDIHRQASKWIPYVCVIKPDWRNHPPKHGTIQTRNGYNDNGQLGMVIK